MIPFTVTLLPRFGPDDVESVRSLGSAAYVCEVKLRNRAFGVLASRAEV